MTTPSARARRAAGLLLVVPALLAGCGNGDDDAAPAAPTAQLQATVVKGPVVAASVCALRIADGGALAPAPSACAPADATGRATLAVPGSSTYLLIASDVRYRDEAAAGTVATLEGTLQAIAAAGAEGSTTAVTINVPTHLAVASLRERGIALSLPDYTSMLDRVAKALQLTPEQARAVPAFDAAGQPADVPAATAAVFADLGRSRDTGVGSEMARFAHQFAKLRPEDDLVYFNRQFNDAAAPRLAPGGPPPRFLLYGWGGTTGPGAVVDAGRRCQATAWGLWVHPMFQQVTRGVFSLCIERAPVGATCDAAFLAGLDYTNVDTNYGAANASIAVQYAEALRSVTAAADQFRIEFANACEPYPTLTATYAGGRLYRPGGLAPFE